MSAVRGLFSVDILWTKGGSSDADVRTLWRKKNFKFFELWCVRTDKGGRGQFFEVLCGHLLWTVLNFQNLKLVQIKRSLTVLCLKDQ